MKTVKKNVYYCDYCKTHKLTTFAMKLHEKHCTANPNRDCRMCGNGGVVPVDAHGEFDNQASAEDLDKLRHDVDNCPACMLAALRQAETASDFDYQKEATAYLKQKREDEREDSGYPQILTDRVEQAREQLYQLVADERKQRGH